MSDIRTRIAPSPTGYIHIGTLRTALWDYYLAKQSGGSFIVRIEDTDQKRFVPGATEALLKVFQDMDIAWDEGPVLLADGSLGEKGEYGPYIQTQRIDLYKPYVDQLLNKGHAYHCFCTAERLEEMREQQRATKQTPKYDRRCLTLPKDEIEQKLLSLQPGDPHVIRMKIPDGISEFEDAIRGKIQFDNADVDDQVIVKSDGIPTYHLAVVVDDYLMKISHVLRGEEWISTTPKQIILHQMLDLPMPVYAHVPLLLNTDKTKLSKRKGDVSVESYLEKGFLPEALKNFLGTLGFNPTGDRELYKEEELVQKFDLSKVNRSGAVVNAEKLIWMNGQYLKEMDGARMVAIMEKFMTRSLTDIERKIVVVEKMRANTLVDIMNVLQEGMVYSDTYASEILVWKKSDASDAKCRLEEIVVLLSGIDSVKSVLWIEDFIKAYITERGLQNGNVLWPLRVALSGAERSLSPFELIWILGIPEALRRIRIAIDKL